MASRTSSGGLSAFFSGCGRVVKPHARKFSGTQNRLCGVSAYQQIARQRMECFYALPALVPCVIFVRGRSFQHRRSADDHEACFLDGSAGR